VQASVKENPKPKKGIKKTTTDNNKMSDHYIGMGED